VVALVCYARRVSVIIYGVRPYGTVDAYGGEHAQTSFFHIWFVPLIPTSSHWITGETADGSTGYSIDMYGKSVLAGYLRVWGPAIAVGTFAAGISGNPILLLISALAIAATVLSWTWRNVRSDATKRRSDFNLVAFGTRCEPRRMPKELQAAFKTTLDERWNQCKPDRSPNDIARHGTKDPNEAVIAYGLLRLAGVMRGRAGREEHADADRILDGAHSTLAIGEGPYREGVQPTAMTGSLATVVQSMAAAYEGIQDSSPEARAERLVRWKRRSRKQLIGLIVASWLAVGAGALFVDALKPTRNVTLGELRGMHPPTGRTVRVTCDSVEGPLWEEVDSHGDATHRLAICVLGQYALPVRLDDDQSMPAKVVEGELREISERLIWVKEGLRKDPELDAHSLEVFVDSSDPNEKIFLGIFGLAIALGVPVLWVLWFRARKQRKAEAAKL
jgi:hypothetical protein